MTTRYTADVDQLLAQPTVSVEDLMPIFGIGRDQAYRMVRDGKIRSLRLGRSYRIPTAAVRELLEGTAA